MGRAPLDACPINPLGEFSQHHHGLVLVFLLGRAELRSVD